MEESKEQNDVSSCSDDDFQSCVSNEEGRLSLLREQEFFGIENENEERQGLLAPPRRRISISSSASRRRTRQTTTTTSSSSNMRFSLPTRISITALFLDGSSSSSIVEQILFFGCGLGSSVSYIATLSALVYFKMMYGPNSFVALNVATYLPLLPVSLAQARWDQYMDQQYQSRRTFLARGVVGFGMVLWGTIGLALSNSPKTTSTHGGTIHMNDASLSSAIRYTLWQGMGSAILYGTLNQMASFVTTSTASTTATATETNNSGAGGGNSLKATVSAGVQASALLVLFLNLVTGFNGDTYEGRTKFPLFLWTVVAVEAVCFVMFLLKLRRPLVAASMLRRDYSIRSDDDNGNDDNDDDTSEPDPFFDEELDYEVPLLGVDDLSSSSKSSSSAGNNSIHGYNDGGDSSIRSGGGDNGDYNSLPLRRRLFDCSSDSSEQRSRQLDDRGHRRGGGGRNQQRRRTNNTELPYYQLWQQTKDCCLVLAGTLIPSFLVGSWFTRVETDWTGLAQVLFYVRIASDFLGRLATIVMPPQSVSCLTWTMILRYIPVVTFFLNSKQEPAQEFLRKIGLGAWTNGNDASSILLVAIIAFQSGYLVTGCFQLAPLALPIELREANQSKQASLLTVAFSVSALLGLASSFTLIAIGV